MHARWIGVTFLLTSALGGCLQGEDTAQEANGAEPVAQSTYALTTVEDLVANNCSETSVNGLATQIVAEVNCLVPNALVAVPAQPNLTKLSGTFAFMQPPARDALVASLKAKPGSTLGINSMLRTVAQQYLLSRWHAAGRCGIPAAATPGQSNHESGLAFDTNQYDTWRPTLEAHGFQWLGPGDVYHFNYVGAGIVNLKGKDVLAFQKLWNLNNPGAKLTEDGIFGSNTEAALKKSPAAGFSTPPTCGPTTPALDAKLVGQGTDAPDDDQGQAFFKVCTSATFHFWFELENTGSAIWTDQGGSDPGQSVSLGVPGDTPDVFTGTTRISLNQNANTKVDPAGKTCNDQSGCKSTVFTQGAGIQGTAPTQAGVYTTTWQLVDNGNAWFGPKVDLTYDVVDCGAGGSGGVAGGGAAGATGGVAGASTTQQTHVEGDDGGCSCRAAGGRTPGSVPTLLLLVLGSAARRRRRRED